MEISREEALSLLSKWRSESSGIFAKLETDAVKSFFSGHIVAASPETVAIGREPHFTLSITLKSIGTLDYSDMREQPMAMRTEYGHIVDEKLQMGFLLGGGIAIYPLKPRE